MRAVLDPGVLIAALISCHGAPAKLLSAWRVGSFDLVVSPRLLHELETVLLRPKFRPYLSAEEARQYVALLRRSASQVEDSARAQVLVSGDRHLTDLRGAQPPVLAPREFLERLQAAER